MRNLLQDPLRPLSKLELGAQSLIVGKTDISTVISSFSRPRLFKSAQNNGFFIHKDFGYYAERFIYCHGRKNKNVNQCCKNSPQLYETILQTPIYTIPFLYRRAGDTFTSSTSKYASQHRTVTERLRKTLLLLLMDCDVFKITL